MQILINGYYGKNNLGDDYILYSILDMLNRYGLENNKVLQVTVMVKNDMNTYKELFSFFPKLTCNTEHINNTKKRYSFLLKNMKDYRIYIYGGGGLFPSDNPKSFAFLLMDTIIAHSNNTDTLLFGIDVAQISNFISKFLWREIITNSRIVLLRNKYSAHIIQGFAKESEKEKVIFSPDLTFSLTTRVEDDYYEEKAILENIGLQGKKYAVWAVANPFSQNEMNDSHTKERFSLLCKQYKDLVNTLIGGGTPMCSSPFFMNLMRDSLTHLKLEILMGV